MMDARPSEEGVINICTARPRSASQSQIRTTRTSGCAAMSSRDTEGAPHSASTRASTQSGHPKRSTAQQKHPLVQQASSSMHAAQTTMLGIRLDQITGESLLRRDHASAARLCFADNRCAPCKSHFGRIEHRGVQDRRQAIGSACFNKGTRMSFRREKQEKYLSENPDSIRKRQM